MVLIGLYCIFSHPVFLSKAPGDLTLTVQDQKRFCFSNCRHCNSKGKIYKSFLREGQRKCRGVLNREIGEGIVRRFLLNSFVEFRKMSNKIIPTIFHLVLKNECSAI